MKDKCDDETVLFEIRYCTKKGKKYTHTYTYRPSERNNLQHSCCKPYSTLPYPPAQNLECCSLLHSHKRAISFSITTATYSNALSLFKNRITLVLPKCYPHTQLHRYTHLPPLFFSSVSLFLPFSASSFAFF